MKKSGGLNILMKKVNTCGENESKDIEMTVRVLRVCKNETELGWWVCVCV